ncbi:hypothetical protein Pres01_46040 [Metapseudomonas resinovorans]|uniref:hypothetical protein n=1 Tax=Metapseudomonas resinovorans TaxID=53412 RepID=UPI001F224B8D|nr:hypothetical protein [Pseudomonas resinovorans]GLZ88553.1 hypothetical protein Pres01_46040 [Pseudomonas resinovorans]
MDRPHTRFGHYRAVPKFFREQQLAVPEHVIESVSILTNLELIVQCVREASAQE